MSDYDNDKGFYVTPEDITTKSQFVKALRHFIATGETTINPSGREYSTSRGELLLVHAFADWLEAHTEIVDKDSGINWFVDLKYHLVEAFDEFRTHPKHETLRSTWASQRVIDDEIPELLDIRGGSNQSLVRYDLVHLMPLIAGRCGGRWLENDLDSYFRAEQLVIDHAWRRFIRKCYREIAPRIKAESHRGNSGVFGRTQLRSYAMAGRVMFTFARCAATPDLQLLDQLIALVDSDGTPADKLAALEAVITTRRGPKQGRDAGQVTFVADDSDMLGYRSGMNTPDIGFIECIAMIEDVVAHWDASKFVEDTGIGF